MRSVSGMSDKVEFSLAELMITVMAFDLDSHPDAGEVTTTS